MSGPRPARVPLVAGNWKMNKTRAEAREWCEALRGLLADGPLSRAELAVCPAFTAIADVAEALAGVPVLVVAQDVHEAEQGAHTGEVSIAMVADAGARGTILGHSERRAAGEGDPRVALKLRAALDAGLDVILCVGESLSQREEGETEAWLEGQLRSALASVGRDEVARLAVAYEPIWAIGTGRTATPETAQDACAYVRVVAGAALDGARLRVLYGGSVTPDNAAALLAQPDVDGTLVGGASLDAAGFAAIAAAAGPPA